MKIISLDVENFLSIGRIKTKLDNVGLNLVLGKNEDSDQFDSNGSGKSSLFESIIWCLFGTSVRELTLDEIVRKDQDSATVSVELDPEDGSENVIVSRTRSKTSRSTQAKAVTLSGVELFPASSITDFQKHLNNWLGLDLKTFINSVYFGKGLAKFFMSANDAERKDLLDTILQIVSFDDALDRAKNKNKELEEKATLYNTEKVLAETRIEEKTEALRNFELLKSNAEKEFKEKEKVVDSELQKINKDLKAIDKSLLENKQTLKNDEVMFKAIKDDIEKKLATFIAENNKKEISAVNTLKRELKQKQLELMTDYDNFLEEITIQEKESLVVEKEVNDAKITKETDIKFLQSKYEENKEKLNKYSTLELDSTCPTCLQNVHSEHVEAITKRLNEKSTLIEGKLTKALNAFQEFQNEVLIPFKNKQKEIADQRKAYEVKLREEQDNLKDTYNNAILEERNKFSAAKELEVEKSNKDLESLTKKFYDETSDLKETIIKLNSSKFQLESKKTSINFEISKLKADISKYDNLITELTGLIEKFKKIVENNSALLEKVVKEQQLISFWVEGFSDKGIKSYIFEQALPFLTDRANFYSTYLTGGTIKIEFSSTTTTKTTNTIKERINITAKNSIGADVYHGNSSGESRRIDLCIIFALQDLIQSRASKSWNTLIMDEVLDYLDATGIQLVIDMFKTFNKKSIYVVSHNSDLKQHFPAYITVCKKDNVSYLDSSYEMG